MGCQSFCREKDSRFCDPCDPASCCNALVSCGSDGAACKGRDALPGQRLTDFVPVIPLISHHRGRRRQVLAQHISTGEVTALPLAQVESQGTTFAVTDPMEPAGHAPLGATNQGGGHPPFVEAGRRGMGFDVSGVIISTSGSGASGGSAESDADNSEKIRSKTPLPEQWRQRL